MKKRRFTERQIIGFLREAEAGVSVKDLCRKHGFSDAAFCGGRSKFRGMQVHEAKRLRELEAENAKLKKLGRGSSGCRGAEGRLRGKTLAPQAKRRAVMTMRQELTISERRACGLVGLRGQRCSA